MGLRFDQLPGWVADNDADIIPSMQGGVTRQNSKSQLGDYLFKVYSGFNSFLSTQNSPLANWIIQTYKGFVQSGNGAGPTPLQTRDRQIIYVTDYYANGSSGALVIGDGVTNCAAGIQNAINRANALGAILIFPPGIYLIGSTTLTFKNNVIYQGSGKDAAGSLGTLIKYTGTSDAIQVNNPINSTTSANYAVKDLAIQCTVRTAGKACFADVGSTFVRFENVQCSGNDVGLICDQTELAIIDGCDFEVPNNATSIGVWLVQGADHTGGGNTYFTNQIKIRNCQFNGISGIGIADDGGVSHTFEGNNFNALTTQIRVTDVYGLRIGDNEFESPVTTSIKIATTRSGGGAGGVSPSMTISNNDLFSSTAINLITLDSTSVTNLEARCNNFNNTNASGNPYSGLSAGATHYYGFGNTQQGTGSATGINNYDDSGTWTPADASGASLSLTVHDATYYRNGKMVDAYYSIVYPTTANGSQAAISGLPFTAANTNDSLQGGPPAYQSSGTYFTWLINSNSTTFQAWAVTGGGIANSTLSAAIIRGNIRYIAK